MELKMIIHLLAVIFQTASVHAADNETAESPVMKVITMLEEMKAQVEKEAEEDQLAYEKYACWCTTNTKEKTAAVKEAESRLEQLNAFVGEAIAKEGELKTQIADLGDDIAADTEALEQATALRAKEKEEFEAEASDMNETITALDEAVKVLSEVQLLQKNSNTRTDKRVLTALAQVRQKVVRYAPKFSDVLQKDLFDVLGSLEGSAPRANSAAFLAQDPSGLSGAAAGAKSYNSRSGSILGMLSEMSDEFGRDLKNAQKEEAQAIAMFEELKDAKEGEIAAATKQIKDKKAELADLKQEGVLAKRDIGKLEKAKAADEAFLAQLAETCPEEAKQYEERVAVRTEEIKALGEALQILTEDDARDLFSKTMAFIQLHSTKSSAQSRAARVERAATRMAHVAKKQGSLSLLSISTRLRLDGFEKVKEVMDKMTAELQKQQKDEDEKKENCTTDIDKTEDDIKVAEGEAQDLSSKFTAVTNKLAVLAEELSKLKSDVAASEVSLKEAGETRKAESLAFQTAIADQRATINILNKVLKRLEIFYSPKSAAALIEVRSHDAGRRQEPGAAAPPAPPKPSDYEKSGGAGGVLQVLAKVISDAEQDEKVIEMGEQKAQSDYATLVTDIKASIEADRDAIASNEATAAENEGVKAETEEAQAVKDEELGDLNSLLKAHHTSCDWLLQYYDVRKQARQEEMDSIADAKAILSGAK
jgi:chromosome segregation ATPase